MFNICAVIKDILRSGVYNIIIVKKYEMYQLDKLECVQVNGVLLKKVNYNLWKKILDK